MFLGLKPYELIIILVIIVLLFGVGRISKIAGELGSGIKAFKKNIRDDSPEEKEESTSKNEDQKKE